MGLVPQPTSVSAGESSRASASTSPADSSVAPPLASAVASPRPTAACGIVLLGRRHLRLRAHGVDARDSLPGAAAIAGLRALLVLRGARRHLGGAHEATVVRLAVAPATWRARHASLFVGAAGLDAPVPASVARMKLL